MKSPPWRKNRLFFPPAVAFETISVERRFMMRFCCNIVVALSLILILSVELAYTRHLSGKKTLINRVIDWIIVVINKTTKLPKWLTKHKDIHNLLFVVHCEETIADFNRWTLCELGPTVGVLIGNRDFKIRWIQRKDYGWTRASHF